MNNITLPKAYDPKNVEDKLSKIWKEKGLFKAQIDEKKQPYTIVIPPPNITGVLHMGHCLIMVPLLPGRPESLLRKRQARVWTG